MIVHRQNNKLGKILLKIANFYSFLNKLALEKIHWPWWSGNNIFSVVYICILINRLHFTKTIFSIILLSLVSSKSWNCVCFWQVIHDKTCLENQLKESHKLEIQNDKMSERKGEGLWGISPPYFPSPASFCSTLWIVHNAYCNKVYSYRLFR